MKLKKVASGSWMAHKSLENCVMRRSCSVSIHGGPSPEEQDDETLLAVEKGSIPVMLTMCRGLEDKSVLLKE